MKISRGLGVPVQLTLSGRTHPDKTFIGRITRGFDFLGYWFSPLGLGVAKRTVERMVDKVARLYEQDADEFRIESYLIHWLRWVRSGLHGLVTCNLLLLTCYLPRCGCWVSFFNPTYGDERSHWYLSSA